MDYRRTAIARGEWRFFLFGLRLGGAWTCVSDLAGLKGFLICEPMVTKWHAGVGLVPR